MPSLGPAEILVILVVGLLVFGPKKMPEIGRQVARGVREFRRVQEHLTSELHSVVSDLDPTAPAPASSGGDPVPTLPPLDTTDTPAPAPTGDPVPTLQPRDPTDAPAPAPAPTGDPAPTLPPLDTIDTPNRPESGMAVPAAADEIDPGPLSEASDSTGGSPSSPPTEPA